jgi:hypothetical protein
MFCAWQLRIQTEKREQKPKKKAKRKGLAEAEDGNA